MRAQLHLPSLLMLLAALLGLASPAEADKPPPLSAQTIRLPSGPSSLNGLGEAFTANISTGTGAFTVPLQIPPAVMKPELAMGYIGGKGKGILGLSFDLPTLQVYRSRTKGAPAFEESDRFAVSGAGMSGDLVAVDEMAGLYRLQNEGAYALFVRHRGDDSWEIRRANGHTLWLGRSASARASSRGRTYRWFVEREEDRFGHWIDHTYVRDGRRVYPDRIVYQSHAGDDYQNVIEFQYEERPDHVHDYSYGTDVLTRWRLRAIVMRHGRTTLRTYAIGYRDGLLSSLVESIQMTGQNGLRQPALTFDYVRPTQDSGRLVTVAAGPPLEGLVDGGATLEDVNRDGLPDLLVGRASDYRYYENRDGLRFADSPAAIAGSPDVGLDEPGVVLVDVDGDGARDVAYRRGDSLRYAPAGDVLYGELSGFGPAVALQSASDDVDFASPLVKMTDLNADGRIDLLHQKPGQDTRLVNLPGDRLNEEPIVELPLDVDFDDPRVSLMDFNGDGELDFVRSECGHDTSRVRVWYGLGQGEYAPEARMVGVPAADPSECHLQDVNGDGQTDLVRISGSWVTYYLNDGDNRFTSRRGDFQGLPSTSTTQRTLFADMNGNGTSDIVWITTDSELKYLDLFEQPNFALLSRIDNGLGMVSEITYRSSVEFMVEAKLAGRPWSTPLPSAIPVIAELRTTDSFERLGQAPTETRVAYEYHDGYFDPIEREFRGFARTVTFEQGDEYHDSAVIETFMHVGRNLETGEDEEALKGKARLKITRDAEGRVYSTEEMQWERAYLCQEDLADAAPNVLPACSRYGDLDASKDELVAISYPVLQVTGTYEATSTPRFSVSASEFDVWGKEIRKTHYGEAVFFGGHEPGDPFDLDDADLLVGDDESTVETDYIYDLDQWLIGLPYEQRTLDREGNMVAAVRTFYDGEGFVGLPLGTATDGLMTRQQGWLAEESRWVPSERNAYDSHGQLIAKLDPNGNRTDLEWDVTHTYPTAELIQLSSDTLRFTARYDTGFGNVVESTDANGRTTLYEYDGLGRITRIAHPGTTLAQPQLRYSYAYGTPDHPISRTTVETLIDTAGAGPQYRESLIFSDGKGKVRLVKLEAEDARGRYLASDWNRYSSRRGLTHRYERFFTDSAEFEEPPVDTPVTNIHLDVLGRETRSMRPSVEGARGVYQQIVYLPYERRVYDETDAQSGTLSFPSITRVDGQDRVVEALKYNEADGAFQELVWSARYDALGHIVEFRDPVWSRDPTGPSADLHRRRYTYDSLGRLVTLRDPNLGRVDYAYDDASNVVRRSDAVGEQTWTFGDADRLIERTVEVPGAAAPEVYSYHYDTAQPGGPIADATHLRGEIAWVEFPTGEEHYSYDARGRRNRESHLLWDPEASPFDAQVRGRFDRTLTYNEGNQVTGLELPGGMALQFGFDGRGYISEVRGGLGGDDSLLLSSLTYDERGNQQRADLGNGIRACHRFNARGLLVEVLTGRSDSVQCDETGVVSGTGLQHLRYHRGPEDMIRSVQDLSAPLVDVPRLDAVYELDRLYQVTRATTSLGTHSYSYDLIQNMVRRDVESGVPSATTGSFGHGEGGASPNMLTSAGPERYAFDGVGQLRQYRGYDLVFDTDGRLRSADKAGDATVRYHYDNWGERRITEVDRSGELEVHRYVFEQYQERDGDAAWFVTAGAATIEVVSTQGLEVDLALLDQLTAYVDDPAQRVKPLPEEYMDLDGDGDGFDADDLLVAEAAYWSGTRAGSPREVWRYYHLDQVGGISHTTDSVGDMVGHALFRPYGEAVSRSGPPTLRGWVGKDTEAEADLGLIRMGERYYAPEIGRWITPDRSIGESPTQMLEKPLESNLYSYALNNPLHMVDLTGTNGTPAVPVPSNLGPPGEWNPGNEPVELYLGKAAHAAIGQYYRGMHINEEVFVDQNLAEIGKAMNSPIRESSPTGVNGADRPDIFNGDTNEVYEIKMVSKKTSVSKATREARKQRDRYKKGLRKMGIAAESGSSSDRAVKGWLPAPGGYFKFWSPEPGVILYEYKKKLPPDGKPVPVVKRAPEGEKKRVDKPDNVPSAPEPTLAPATRNGILAGLGAAIVVAGGVIAVKALGCAAGAWAGPPGCAVGAAVAPSDERLKSNVRAQPHGLDEVMRLRSVTYDWRHRPDAEPALGLVAQELEEVIPELVHRDAQSGLRSVDYNGLLPVLIRATQELERENVRLAEQNRALQGSNASLHDRALELETEMGALRELVGELRALQCARAPGSAVCQSPPRGP